MIHMNFNFNQTKIPNSVLLHNGPIKHPNKSVQMKVILLYSAVRRNRLNIILVFSAEVEVEIFLSNRVKTLHELQSVLDSLR